MKRPRGKPVRAIWDAMNDYKSISLEVMTETEQDEESYSQHRLLFCEFGDPGHKLISLLWWENAIEPC